MRYFLLAICVISCLAACQATTQRSQKLQKNDYGETPQINLRCNNCTTAKIKLPPKARNKYYLGDEITLLVISPENDNPQWFILSDIFVKKITNPPDTLHWIHQISVSENGKYLGIISSGEGHPLLTVIELNKLLSDTKHRPILEIDPYPGAINIYNWENNNLILSSDMLLTHRIDEYDRVPSELMLFSSKKFSLNIESNQISAVSENIKTPVNYYGKHLTISPDEYSPLQELEALRKLDNPKAIPYLKAALKMERYSKNREYIKQVILELNK